MGESSNLATRIYATLIFQPIRETEKRSRDDLDVSDWLKFQRSVNYAENNVYRIGSSFLKTLRFMVTLHFANQPSFLKKHVRKQPSNFTMNFSKS